MADRLYPSLLNPGTQLQHDMALAMMLLVEKIERDNKLTGRTLDSAPNGIYRLKLQGRQIEESFERFFGATNRTEKIPFDE